MTAATTSDRRTHGSVVAGPPTLSTSARRPSLHTAGLLASVLAPSAVLAYLWGYVGKPLWHDEQWRAYYVSRTDDFWAQLHGSVALSAGWVALEKLSIAVLGNTEWALRLPTVAFVVALTVATYLAARHWLQPLPALLAAGLPGGNCAAVAYGVQLKPFVIDATAAVLAVMIAIWLARPGPRSSGRLLLGYLALGLCTVLGTAAVFVVGPLLALDGWRALRAGRLRARLPGVLTCAAVVGVHLQLFVRVQTGLGGADYWGAQFLPTDSFRSALRFVGAQLASFVPGVATGVPVLTHTDTNPIAALDAHFGAISALVAVGLVVGLVAGTVRGLRSSAGRTLLTATYGALAATLLAAALRQWPFGYVRPNLFLLPLVYLVAVLGWDGLARSAAGRLGAPAPPRGSVTVRPLAGALLLARVPGVALSFLIDAARVGQLHRQRVSGGGFGIGIRDAVAYTRAHTGPADIAVVVGEMPREGWAYYARDYAGYPPEVAALADRPGRTVYVARHGDVALDGALDAAPAAPRVLLFVQSGTGSTSFRRDVDLLRRHGYCPTASRVIKVTGQLRTFERCRSAG